MVSETTSSTPAAALPYGPGDEVFVYATRSGLVTRLEGWALSILELVFGEGYDATVRRMVAVFRDADGNLDIASPLSVAPVAEAAAAWHLVAPDDGRIVGGGTRDQGRKPSMTREELEELRDSGRFKFLAGSVAVLGLPDGVEYAPSAGTTDPITAPVDGSFTASRGGWYRWFDLSSYAPENTPSTP
ncbi:hypothetical protein [Streptomyces ipomoeae]|uniref:hypothetical protein n=1 Tax=Streptomyces ipomoeae TaxID=103232 RepID=UPI0029A3207A|nr:hypothetical protein [Streptomyces ipomoeae]MDX2697148.1 hypothetical protein [Streptomyces ipomoeae]MDX2843058.1 hypothetical protein [Streptomyces ipomoeae]